MPSEMPLLRACCARWREKLFCMASSGEAWWWPCRSRRQRKPRWHQRRPQRSMRSRSSSSLIALNIIHRTIVAMVVVPSGFHAAARRSRRRGRMHHHLSGGRGPAFCHLPPPHLHARNVGAARQADNEHDNDNDRPCFTALPFAPHRILHFAAAASHCRTFCAAVGRFSFWYIKSYKARTRYHKQLLEIHLC